MAESLYTLQEIREYVSKHKSVTTSPEDIFSYWQSKKWKTKKGVNVRSISAAVSCAHGTLNYFKNKEIYKSKEKKIKTKYKEMVASARKERANPKPKPYQRYSDQLNRPEWKAFRQFIFAVRNKECELCGAKTYLQIHHLRYVENRRAWEYLPEDMMVLCDKCHKKVHGIQ